MPWAGCPSPDQAGVGGILLQRMNTSEFLCAKPREFGARTLFITLPLISPRSLFLFSWSVCAGSVQSDTGCRQWGVWHKLPLWFPSFHHFPNSQVDHCQKHLEASRKWQLALWIYLGKRELLLTQWALRDWLKLRKISKWRTWKRIEFPGASMQMNSLFISDFGPGWQKIAPGHRNSQHLALRKE